MNLPQITHLQFAVLSSIVDGKKSGFEIRDVLNKLNSKKSLPAFYQLMARMEEGKLVKGEYVDSEVNGERVRERHYRITANGARVHQAVAEFYVKAAGGMNEA